MKKNGLESMETPEMRLWRERTKARLAKLGYRILHRRKGQFWLMLDKPMTPVEIDRFVKANRRH
jgi:hypothetical protein